jgi:hypothetical protein
VRYPPVAILVYLTGQLACAGRVMRQTQAPVAAATPQAMGANEQLAVWEAVLRFYSSRRGATEGDLVGRTYRVFDTASAPPLGSRVPVVLETARERPLVPYDSSWLADIVRRHLVAGTCASKRLTQCSDTVLTTYVTLDEPMRMSEDTVIVRVLEMGLNPRVCRRHDALVGFQDNRWRLVRLPEGWRVLGGWGIGSAGSSSCRLISR